jgi:DNA-binding NarL/FixJ family response regulator
MHFWRNEFDAARRAVDETLDILAEAEDLAVLGRTVILSAMVEGDAAERARASRDVSGAAVAEARLLAHRDVLARAAESVPHPPGSDLELRGHLALTHAEHRRAGDHADPAAWRAAVELLAERRMAYLVAYGRFRLAEALLADRGDRAEAAELLRIAHDATVGLGARPLRERIEQLATRGRVSLEAAISPDAVEASVADPLGAYDLTPREVEVLRLVARGRTNRQIAEELFISESTAGVHVSHIIGKLGVGGRVEAATIATRLGLMD